MFFIHGWPINHKMFEYQFTQLPKEGYRCIGIDLETSTQGTIKLLESLRDEDLRGDLAKIQISTAIFHGKLDKICPFAFAGMVNEEIENSKLISFET